MALPPQAATEPEPTPAAPPSPVALKQEIGFTLVEVTRLMRAAFDERMRCVGLTGTTWRLLVRLSRQDGQSQAALARQLEVTPVALGETIDRLEKSGHVERRADPRDRRKWRIHLTEEAVALMPRVRETAEALMTECYRDVRDDELGLIADALCRLRTRLHEMRIDAADEEGEA